MRRKFGKSVPEEEIPNIINKIWTQEFVKTNEIITNAQMYFHYVFHYLFDPKDQLTIFFITDDTDEIPNVKRQLEKTKKEFTSMFGSLLSEMATDSSISCSESDFDIFLPVLENVHKNLKPKISMVGFSGVGKTTITRLIQQQDIPVEHIPTISGEIGTIKIGKLFFNLWDFAGQEQFSFLWEKFVQGSDGIFIITDSSYENCEKSKFFVDLIKSHMPNAHVAVIGNKQDLPFAVPIKDIERLLGMKAYSMVATDPNHRVSMMNIIADVLEIDPGESDLFKPLVERDRLMKELECAINAGDLLLAMGLSEQLGEICLKMGDDMLSQSFYQKAQEIKASMGNLTGVVPKAAPDTIKTLPPVIAPPVSLPAAPAPVPLPSIPGSIVQSDKKIFDVNAPGANVAETLKEIALRLANINNLIADLEMQNIEGKLADDAFKEKTARLQAMKAKLEAEKAEIEKIK
jgi:small GTP-binding protein